MKMKHVLAVLSVVFGLMAIVMLVPDFLYAPIGFVIGFSVLGLLIAIFTVKASRKFADYAIMVNVVVFSVVFGLMAIVMLLPDFLYAPIGFVIGFSVLGLLIAIFTVKASRKFAAYAIMVNGVVVLMALLEMVW